MVTVFVLAFIYLQKREIKSHNIRTGGEVYVGYDSVARDVETKNFYVLRTKARQSIIIDKAGMIQAQKSDAFIRFLRSKCKNAQWRLK